jgi:hypothetical protein
MAKMIEIMVPSLKDTMAKACKRFRKRIEGVVEAGGDYKDIDEQHLQVWHKYVQKTVLWHYSYKNFKVADLPCAHCGQNWR